MTLPYFLLNALSLLLCYLWNAGILLGTFWLILEKDWSPWTLVITILFISKLDRYEPKEKEENNTNNTGIILTNK